MKTAGLSRFALAMGAASALLAGCGGSQPPISAPGAMSQSSAITGHGDRRGSWMLPGTSGQDLVYAAGGCGGLCVLSYPDGKLRASISIPEGTGGACSDSQGNVFVTSFTDVLEFAHGGTTAIATLALPGYDGLGCGVDPTTGNLAVVFSGTDANVAVFPGATGTPTLYNTHILTAYCGYDNAGNLYVSGAANTTFTMAILPSGGSAFTTLTTKDKLGSPGEIQWDGTHVTYEGTSTDNIKISRLHVSGSKVSVVGTTHFKGAIANARQSWLVGDRVIIPYSTKGQETNKISVWPYPKTGKAVAKFGNFGQSKITTFVGVTLSLATSH